MKIQDLILRNFRNIPSCTLNPGRGINVLVGENGQGKTNLLESIYFLSNLSTFRSSSYRNMIRHGEPSGTIHARILSSGIRKNLAVHLGTREKIVRINGKGVSRGVDFFGIFVVLLFSPESLKITQAGPEFRRRFLDSAISRIDRGYLLELKRYRKILEQRNRLLRMIQKGRVARTALAVWDEQLSQSGSRIIWVRYRYLAEFLPVCSAILKEVAHKQESFRILYRSTLYRKPGDLSGVEELTLSKLRQRFSEGIHHVHETEVRNGTTRIGPHLDDLIFEVRGRTSRGFASQGESRLLALTLTLSEAEIFREKQKNCPVLLLDDVYSELDRRHQGFLNEKLRELGQVFLTTTDEGIVGKMIPVPSLYRVESGKISLVKKGDKM